MVPSVPFTFFPNSKFPTITDVNFVNLFFICLSNFLIYPIFTIPFVKISNLWKIKSKKFCEKNIIEKHRHGHCCQFGPRGLRFFTFFLKLMNDQRLRFQMMLKEANVPFNDYALQAMRNLPPPTIPRKDTFNSKQ